MKIVVSGCSYSAYTKVDKNYGDYLSEYLGIDVEHLVKGCAGNDFILRVITSAVREGRITKNDIVVIQYSNLERREFWVDDFPALILDDGDDKEYPQEYQYGRLSYFKVDSHTWERDKVSELHKLYETISCNMQYEEELFRNSNFLLLNTLESMGIQTVILQTRYISDHIEILQHPYKFIKLFNAKHFQDNYPLGGDDYGHLSSTGHKKLGVALGDFIKDNYITTT